VDAISTAGASALKSLTHPTGYIPRARIDEITCAPGEKAAENAQWLTQAQPDGLNGRRLWQTSLLAEWDQICAAENGKN
jgi:hypothetical protein